MKWMALAGTLTLIGGLTLGTGEPVVAQCSPSGAGIDPAPGVAVSWPANPNACCYRWTASGPGLSFFTSPIGSNGTTLYGLAYGSSYSYSVESSPDGNAWGGWCSATFTTIDGSAVNDDACSAIALNMGTTCGPIAGSLEGASGVVEGGMPVLAWPDVWYSFEAVGPFTTVKVQSSEQVSFEVYDESCDQIPTTGTPWSGSTYADGVGHINTDQFDAGQTYFVRVFQFLQGSAISDAEFTICAYSGDEANDCAGTPGGNVGEGEPCDDQDPCTITDVYDATCVCVGTFSDDDQDGICNANDQCPGGPDPGQSCTHPDPCVWQAWTDQDCQCVGDNDIDDDDVPNCDDTCPWNPGVIGGPCDDNNPYTANDVVNEFCGCQGQAIDCLDEIGGPAQPGTPCDDGNPSTTSDHWLAYFGNDGRVCLCAGSLEIDCEGILGGFAQPGSGCSHPDPCVSSAFYDASCQCVGWNYQPDSDNDGACDIVDSCPTDPDKIDPGVCGCNTPDISITWFADTDGDGFGDPDSPLAGFTCSQPVGYVADNTDDCPNVVGVFGSLCDDGDPNTVTALNPACVCDIQNVSVRDNTALDRTFFLRPNPLHEGAVTISTSIP